MITYLERGGPEPVVVFLHGIGSNATAFSAVLDRLPVRGLAWNMPGYAGSAPLRAERPAVADYADAVVEWLDELGVAAFRLVGSSIGALIAASVAAAHPSRVLSLVLSSPAPGGGGTAELAAREALIGLGPERMATERVPILIPSGSPAAVASARAATLALDPAAYLQAAHALAFGDIFASLARLPRIPVTVLCGDADRVTPLDTCVRPVAAAVQGSVLEVAPGCGHILELEAPELVIRSAA